MELSNKRIWVFGLLTSCPLDKPIEICPAQRYRIVPELERIKIVETLSDEEINDIIAFHEKCIRYRESIQ